MNPRVYIMLCSWTEWAIKRKISHHYTSSPLLCALHTHNEVDFHVTTTHAKAIEKHWGHTVVLLLLHLMSLFTGAQNIIRVFHIIRSVRFSKPTPVRLYVLSQAKETLFEFLFVLANKASCRLWQTDYVQALLWVTQALRIAQKTRQT